MVDNFRAAVMDLLAPPRCHWCGLATGGPPVCPPCAMSLPWNTWACRACALPLPAPIEDGVCATCLGDAPPQDRSWAAFRYEAPVTHGILELKFRGRLAPARVLGHLMAARLTLRAAPMPDLLIPVPLHARRLRRRGYNQALELGRELARHLSLRLAPGAADRTRATGEQTRLDAAGRRRNVRGAFRVDARVVRDRHVALLDDVITTGATVAELARAARRAGASRIEVWSAARVR